MTLDSNPDCAIMVPMTTVQLIYAKPDLNEYEVYNLLVAEKTTMEEQGLLGDDYQEVVDEIDAIGRSWDEQQAGEIDAEMAIERYYEGGWDKTGEYSRELYR